MTIQEAKNNLSKEIDTPIGRMILYDIVDIPPYDTYPLLFVHSINNNKDRDKFFIDDCSVVVIVETFLEL